MVLKGNLRKTHYARFLLIFIEVMEAGVQITVKAYMSWKNWLKYLVFSLKNFINDLKKPL